MVLFIYSLYKTVNTRLKNIYLSFTSIFQPFDSGMVPGNFKSGCKLFLGQYSFQSCQLVRSVTIYIITLKSWIVLSPWEADRDPRGTPDPVNTGGSLGRTDLQLVTLSFNMSQMIYMGIWEHLVAIKHDLPVIRNLPHIRPVWHSEFMFEKL